MSDYNSSLPIRTENDGDVVAKIADATIPSQQLKVEADGSINTNAVFASGSQVEITDGTDTLEINADGSINSVVTATNLDIRDLAFATDKVDVSGSSVTVSATDLDIRDLAFATDSVDVSGSSVTVSATDLDIRDLAFATDKVDVTGSDVTATVTATDLDIRDLSAAQDNVAISDGTDTLAVNTDGSINSVVTATNLDIRDLAFATDKVDVSGSSVTVSATDLDIRDLSHTQDSVKIGDGTDFLEVNSDGSINVKISDSSPGVDTNDYNTATVAGGASSTHTFTSTGNFYLTQIEASGSGKMKIEVRVNSVTKFVQFNSTANPNMHIEPQQPPLATSGQTVTVIRTNKENQSQDVYSTISGYTI